MGVRVPLNKSPLNHPQEMGQISLNLTAVAPLQLWDLFEDGAADLGTRTMTTSMHDEALERQQIRSYYGKVAEMLECPPEDVIRAQLLGELHRFPINRTRIETLLNDLEIVVPATNK